ncbi:MAG TPA: DcaP family trimeric outer membrane transporter [Chitinophagaceae bacterium]
MKYILIPFLIVAVLIQTSAQENTDDVPAGWWKIPKTNARITIGGYVKFDLIQDFNPISSPSFFDVSKIPTDGSKGMNTHLQANETRLILDFRTPAGKTDLRTYVEGDFYGTSGAFRLRHAYVEIGGKLLAGQYWSNFMDENVIPPTLDFEKPTAYAFVRHGMIRYKITTSKKSYIGIALEEPFINVQAPVQPGKMESFLPDFTARYRYTDKWGHIQLSGFAGVVRFRPTTGSTENTGIFGVNLSGQINFLKKDYFIYQVIAGPGISRYRTGKYAAPDVNDDLDPIAGVGYTAGIRHFWSPAVSSLIVANYGTEDNTVAQPGSDLKEAFYGAVNVIWQFHKSAFAGIEYLHGGRTNINNADGKANRVQFSIQVDINKH